MHVDTSPGFTERLVLTVRGLKPGTPLVLFTLQVPNAPFGVGWYQGDVVVGPKGRVTETFISRAQRIEQEALAPWGRQAEHAGNGVQARNSAQRARSSSRSQHLPPRHRFNSVEAAEANGAFCPTNKTAFNGDHTAGPQVLNSGRFPDTAGPLSHIQ